MLNTPFTPWPCFSEAEADAVRDVILSNRVNYWTGEECRNFETEFAQWTGTRYAVALANGTVALDIALKALEIGAGDEVIVTARTFLASVSSIVNCGATPIFADVNALSQNITVDTIKAVVSDKTRAIVCVHLAGWPCDMDPILEFTHNTEIKIIEDCAQAHGAYYKGRAVGSMGDIGAWSFCQDKIMSTGGEGGMVTTNDEVLWRKMWSYKDHGKSYDAIYNRKHAPGFRWVHETFGTNWRMTEMQAVLGRIQLKSMQDWSEKRRLNASKIWHCASLLPGLIVPIVPDDIKHAAYKCYIFVDRDKLNDGWSRDRIITEIVGRGVPCYSGSCSEVYLEKAFDYTGYRPETRLPNAMRLGETSLMFLVHPNLLESEIEMTCTILTEVLNLATSILSK